MSCDTGQKQGARAAARSGIAAGVSKKAFYLGSAAGGTVLGGMLLLRYFSRRQQITPLPAKPPAPPQVNSLVRPDRVEPTAIDKIWGQRCATCKTPVQGNGLWYTLNGRLYCQECAQGQAAKAGIHLVRPAPAKSETKLVHPQTGRRTTLKPRMVKVGPVENVAGYAVWTGKKDTGLTLVPEVKLEANGQVKVNKSRWFVNYDRASRSVAGPYSSVREARGMASLLAHFDWTKEVEDFKDEEIRAVTQLANDYRAEIEFVQHLRQIAAT